MTKLQTIDEQMTCIICPMGCSMEVSVEYNDFEKKVTSVRDNSCPRGEQYAIKEISNPTRTLTTTVLVRNGEVPLVSVKTAAEIPKLILFNAMEILRRTTVDAPITCGQIIIKDLLGTAISVVACTDVEIASKERGKK